MSSESGGGDIRPPPESEMSEVRESSQVDPPGGPKMEIGGERKGDGPRAGESGMGHGSETETQQQQVEIEDEVSVVDDVTTMSLRCKLGRGLGVLLYAFLMQWWALTGDKSITTCN